MAIGSFYVARLEVSFAEANGSDAPIATQNLPQRQLLLTPPEHVGRVAERAHHQDAGALLRIRQLTREDLHWSAKERRNRRLAEEVFVPLVFGMGGDADTRGQELGARRRDR